MERYRAKVLPMPALIYSQLVLTTEDKNWAMACHLAALSGYVGVPFGHVVGPLIVWAIRRDSSEFVDMHGKESINFHLSITVYAFGAGLLFFLAFFAPLLAPRNPTGAALSFGVPILLAVFVGGFIWIMATVCTIIAAIKAGNGEKYLYPFAIQFFR
jgi:hypothetical protein